MFRNTYYLHWEDWPTAVPYPSLPPITPPSLDSTLHAAYIYDRQAETDTPLSSMTTHFPGEIRPLSR